MASRQNPFGDGKSSPRIADILARELSKPVAFRQAS
jgi:UDP-N-acetylglucosamine 2-epimerase